MIIVHGSCIDNNLGLLSYKESGIIRTVLNYDYYDIILVLNVLIINVAITLLSYQAEFIVACMIIIDAQLTSPTEDVCLGNGITFMCKQNGTLSRWTINLPSTPLTNIVLLQPVGTTLTFQRDPGFHFQIHIISNTSSSITTQLNVTAVRQLDGVEVVCDGASGSFMSVIRIASIGESSQAYNS